MPSFSSKSASSILLLLNLATLFLFKGGRNPIGLAAYPAISVCAFLLAFPKISLRDGVSRLLLATLAAWAISTAVNLPGTKGWVHGSTVAAHALNFFTFLLIARKQYSRIFLGVAALFSTFPAFLSLIRELFLRPDTPYLTFLPNTNLDASYLNVAILTVSFFLMVPEPETKRLRTALGGLLAVLVAGQMTLLSRGAVLALFAGLACGLATGMRRAFRVVAAVLIFFLFLLAFFQRPANYLASKTGAAGLTSRVTVWRGAALAWKQRLILGWGLGGFERAYKLHRPPMETDVGRYEKTTAFAHNEYLQIAVETGLLGLMAWLAFVFVLLKRGVSSVRRDPSRWDISAVLACAVSFLAHAMIDFNLHLPLLGYLFAFFCAVLAQGPDAQEQECPGNVPRWIRFGLAAALSAWMMVSSYALGTLWLGQKQTARAVQLNPLSRELLEKLISLPDTDENVSAVRAALPWHQKEDRPFAYLARYYFRRGQMEDSALAYLRAIENNPKSPFYMTELADLYLAQKNVWAAAPLYWMALELEPFYLYPRARLAGILAAGGKKKEAFEAFQEIRNIQEENLPADSEYTRRLLNLP